MRQADVRGGLLGGRSVGQPRPAAGLDALRRSHWRQVRDVRLRRLPEVTVDHVVAGPGGVHVVEYVAGAGTAVEAEVDSVARAAAELADLLPLRYRARVQPVVCLVDGEASAETRRGVLVTTPDTLGHIVRSTPAVLSTSEVAEAFGILSASLAPAADPHAEGRRRAGWRRYGGALVAAAVSAALLAAVLFGPGAAGLSWLP